MMNSIIKINGLSAGYDGKTVLNQVDLTVYERDFLGIIGPNGGGKTTLIKCILGLHQPFQGCVRFYKEGREVPEINMGYLPQYNSIDKKFPISVYEVILSGLSKQKTLLSRYTSKHHEQVKRIIARMGLEGLEKRAIGELSGGQLQRTLLGRAIVSNPRVLVLDEPLSYVDKAFESRLYEIIAQLAQRTTIILVSHEMTRIATMANRHIIIDRTLHECSAEHHYVATECK